MRNRRDEREKERERGAEEYSLFQCVCVKSFAFQIFSDEKSHFHISNREPLEKFKYVSTLDICVWDKYTKQPKKGWFQS